MLLVMSNPMMIHLEPFIIQRIEWQPELMMRKWRWKKRACPRDGDRPFLLPVGDEEEERERGDDEVDEEDH